MTSPGGNLVEIRVVAVDQTGPGFDSAAKRARALAAAVSGGPGSASAALKDAEKQATGLGGTLRRVGETAAGFLAANAIQAMAQRAVQLVKSTVQAASALGESVNAVEKTFGSASTEIKAFGETSAESAGLSTRAFNQMAVPLGAMLKNAGLSMEEVTEQTIKLTKRAADMGSVFYTDVSQVLAAIQAGLRGEIDPLERFGVSLSAAAVEAKALADSGKESVKELTAQEKALARLNLIYEQTADTQNDFADTADSLANSQRRSTAAIENAQAQIGTTFLPIFAKAAQLTGQLAESFGNMPAPVQMAAVAVVGLGAAIGLLAPKALAAKAALDSMAASDSRLQRGMAKTAVVAGKAGAAFAALGLVTMGVSAAFGEDLNPQIDAATKGLTEWDKRAKLSGEAARLFGEDAKVLEMSMQQLAQGGLFKAGDQVGQFLSSILGAPGPLGRAKEHVEAFDAALVQMVRDGHAEEAAQAVAHMAISANISIEEALKLLPQYAAAMEVGGEKTKGLAAAAAEAEVSLDELSDQIDDSINKAFGYEEAQDRAAEAVARLIEQIKQQREEGEAGAGTLDRNTEAGRANAEMVRGLVRDYKDLMVQAQADGRAVDGLRQELEDQLTAMFGSRAEAQRYVAQLVALEQQMAQIKSKEVRVRVKIEQDRIFGGGVTEFADGGIWGGAGKSAATGGVRSNRVLVGEEGPEVVDLPTGSRVYPHGQSMGMLGQGGGGPAEVRVVFEFRGAEDEFKKLMRKITRVDGGGDVQVAFGT